MIQNQCIKLVNILKEQKHTEEVEKFYLNFKTTGEVTSENIVSTDPTTITGKKRKEESYTGEWYEGPYVDYGIEDLFNFQEGKYKDGIDLVEAGKWRSARGFTATDLQYWYYYTQNNIPYGHTKECREKWNLFK